MRNILKILFLTLAPLFFFGCSDDDKKQEEVQQICYPTNISMIVNGEFIEMAVMGRGLMLTPNGYILDMNFEYYLAEPNSVIHIRIELPYNKTGKDILNIFKFSTSTESGSSSVDLSNGEFTSEVISNNKNCFYCKFSGTLTKNGKTFEISEGVISYTYEEPF